MIVPFLYVLMVSLHQTFWADHELPLIVWFIIVTGFVLSVIRDLVLTGMILEKKK